MECQSDRRRRALRRRRRPPGCSGRGAGCWRRAPGAATPVRQSRARVRQPPASCPPWRHHGGTPRRPSRLARPSSVRWSTSVSCRCRRWWRSPGTRPTEDGARAHSAAPCGACRPPARWWRRRAMPPASRRRRGRCRFAGRLTSQRRSARQPLPRHRPCRSSATPAGRRARPAVVRAAWVRPRSH